MLIDYYLEFGLLIYLILAMIYFIEYESKIRCYYEKHYFNIIGYIFRYRVKVLSVYKEKFSSGKDDVTYLLLKFKYNNHIYIYNAGNCELYTEKDYMNIIRRDKDVASLRMTSNKGTLYDYEKDILREIAYRTYEKKQRAIAVPSILNILNKKK